MLMRIMELPKSDTDAIPRLLQKEESTLGDPSYIHNCIMFNFSKGKNITERLINIDILKTQFLS